MAPCNSLCLSLPQAKANRGILYVDEVNLLDDGLVDVVLDSAASGLNTVEREGVSIVHPAKFIMIGSGNPAVRHTCVGCDMYGRVDTANGCLQCLNVGSVLWSVGANRVDLCVLKSGRADWPEPDTHDCRVTPYPTLMLRRRASSGLSCWIALACRCR